MGNKLNSMNTRLGDDGATDIGDRLRLAKNHERVEAYGAIDELNCAIGMVVAKAGLPKAVFECLLQVQRELIDLAGELYVPKRMVMASVHVERLERELDAFNQPLQSLKESILPGGGPMAAACHFARAVARRFAHAVACYPQAIGGMALSGPAQGFSRLFCQADRLV